MSTNDIITALESVDFDLDDSTSVDPTLICGACTHTALTDGFRSPWSRLTPEAHLPSFLNRLHVASKRPNYTATTHISSFPSLLIRKTL